MDGQQQVSPMPVAHMHVQSPKVSTNANTPITQHQLKACTGCKARKIKCRNNDDPNVPCERCTRLQIPCVYADRNVRAGVRSRSPMSDTSNHPKRRLVARAEVENEYLRIGPQAAANGCQSDAGALPSERRGITLSQLPYVARPQQDGKSDRNSSGPRANTTHTTPTNVSGSHYDSPGQTIPRSLQGVRLEAEQIDSHFAVYFKHYHPFLPALNPETTPNEYYAQSSFLFWSIISVASRRRRDSPLLPAIRTKVLSHVRNALFSASSGISSIKAILLLLNWDFAEAEAADDMVSGLSSALLHCAIKHGMNIPSATQDFTRLSISLTANERRERYELYLYCLLTYQRFATCKGYSVSQTRDVFSGDGSELRQHLPKSLRFQSSLSDDVTNASIEIEEGGIDLSQPAELAGFDEKIKIHTSSYVTLSKASFLSPVDRLYLCIPQLMLHTLEFIKPITKDNLTDWKAPFDAACEFTHQFNDLEKSTHVDLYGTSYVFHGVLVAACTLLRCLKTPFADTIGRNASTGQALFFSTMNMIRNLSLGDGDKAAKSAWALQNLWRSDTIFKRKDGSWDLDLHFRNRFGSNVIYDAMWWSRAELSNGEISGHQWTQPEQQGHPLTSLSDGFEPDLLVDLTLPHDWVASGWEIEASMASS